MTPRNDFRCEQCQTIFEAGRGSDNPPPCPHCGGDTKLIFTETANIQVRKTPGYKDKDPHVSESDLDEMIEEWDQKDWEPSQQDIEDWEAVDGD